MAPPSRSSADVHRYTGQPVGAHCADEPFDRPVRQPDAAVAARRSQRVEQAGAAAAVDPHAAVAAAEFLEHVAVRGDREDVGAEEGARLRWPDVDDREQSTGGGRRGGADDHAEAAEAVATAIGRDRAGSPRDDQAPTGGLELDAVGVDPGGRVVWAGGPGPPQA